MWDSVPESTFLPNLHVFTNLWKLSKSCSFGILWMLPYIGISDQITGLRLIQPSTPLPITCPKVRGVGLRVLTLYRMSGSPYNQPSAQVRSKSHLIHIMKDTFLVLITEEIPRVQSSVPEMEAMTKYIYLTISNNFAENKYTLYFIFFIITLLYYTIYLG